MKNLTTETRCHAEGMEIGPLRDRAIGTIAGFCHQRLRRAAGITRASLREIFDENAYERFLARTQSSRSAASYGQFLREREAATARKPRCC